jgi:hypothetical protein
MDLEWPMKVSECAKVCGVSGTTVRRWISDGFLEIDAKQRPMQIVEGKVPVTRDQWKKRMRKATAGVPRGLWGMSESGAVHIVNRKGETLQIDYSEIPATADRAEREIAAFVSHSFG